jgi:hypothetical protein
MICQWCHRTIVVTDIGKPCSVFPHRPDNRHYPLSNPCPCGRLPSAHRVSHQPKGEPCAHEIMGDHGEPVGICGLPASSHITRKPISSPSRVRQLRQRDGWVCQLCDRELGNPPVWPHPMSVTIDHIIPIGRGGCDDLSNLQLAHRRCNLKKQNDNPSPRQKALRETVQEKIQDMLKTSLPKIILDR